MGWHPDDVLRAAHAAAAVGDWRHAFELFGAADADGRLTLQDLPVLADSAYGSGHLDATIETWERAHTIALDAGERTLAAAAAVRVAMHLLFDTALMAPVRGWLGRADQLLDAADTTPAHAWLAVVRNYERMLSGDVEGATAWARLAMEIGAKCDPAAAAVGTVAAARLRILDGDVATGLAMLDDAGVTAVSGALDPMSTGVVFCELVCALQGLAQYDRAEEWTEAMERWSRTNAIGSLHGRCRVHRAEILRLRGRCDEAEAEAMAACEELRPYLRRELGWPLTELGRIRLHRGDVAGAEEALIAADHLGWQAHPGLALVWIARDDAAAAVSALRDALSQPSYVPSKERPPNTDLWRAPLLEAQVEAEVGAGDRERARDAAAELGAIAARYDSAALRAGAATAHGRVCLADADPAGAERAFTDAARLWNEVGAPYEVARARIGLADAYEASNRGHLASAERDAARALLDDLRGTGATRNHDTEQSSFRLEGDTWSIDFDGQTVHVRDIRGMHYLAQLLSGPGREFHVLDLVAFVSATPNDASASRMMLGDAGELLDGQAKDAYRRRLAEIDNDIERARAAGDAGREAQADEERDFLLRELSRAVGLGGRDRRASSASERARAAVTRAIRQAIARIGDHHRSLGDHLEHTVRTGTYCAYVPDTSVGTAWRL
jgi:tetratricopeptide (TPR) repeat protein